MAQRKTFPILTGYPGEKSFSRVTTITGGVPPRNDHLRQTGAEGEDALFCVAHCVAEEGQREGAVEVDHDLGGGQRQTVGQDAPQHRGGEAALAGEERLALDGTEHRCHARKAEDGQHGIGIGGIKEEAGKQVEQIEAGLHQQGLQRVQLQISQYLQNLH